MDRRYTKTVEFSQWFYAMRIGELSRRSKLPRDTIRFYERNGLIGSAPSAEASNDYRDYPEETVERLKMIGVARAAGFSVTDLRLLLQAMEGAAEPGFDPEGYLDGKIAELKLLIAQSERLLDVLSATRAALSRVPG